MAEETQVLSIQQRIAALKQAQAGQSTDIVGSPFLGSQPTPLALRPSPVRAKPIINPPSNGNGSVVDRPPIGNEPRLPQRPPPSPTPSTSQKPKVPPPLPTRKASNQQLAPTLPARRPSIDPSRRSSVDSVASSISSISLSRTAGTSSTSIDSGVSRVRSPPYDETNLPPLPPRREEPKSLRLPPRPKLTNMKSRESLMPPPLPSIREPPSQPESRPTLPPRRSSNQITLIDNDPDPQLPPRLPSRDGGGRSHSLNGEARSSARRIPPPPSDALLGKLQQSGFGGLKNNVEDANRTLENGFSPESIRNGVPPPVPIASRPDLSKLQATKPRLNASNLSTTGSSTICLRCRDFSHPDSHAAQYPRESLPTHDLGWLARELTAPFPSHTDKARALFTWCHHNIEYNVKDFFNNCVKPSTPASTLASGLAVCEGYAALFKALADHAGMEAKVITGHGKGYGYEPQAPGAKIPPYNPAGHAWNVVRIDNGQWKLIDVCWGAGACNGPGLPYIKRFEPAMFTISNDEFGLKHFPRDQSHFYRDDGRPAISWEEYILGDPNSPFNIEQPNIWGDASKHSIGDRSFLPQAKQISVYQSGPLRFQFGLICEHWTLERHSKIKPAVFLLCVNGVDGRKDERIPFNHVRGSGPGGGGDIWYLDVPDARVLGAPGQRLQIAVLTSLGEIKDARAHGVTVEEYKQQVGRVGMSWAGIAEWELV